jgi:hypothetical protein
LEIRRVISHEPNHIFALVPVHLLIVHLACWLSDGIIGAEVDRRVERLDVHIFDLVSFFSFRMHPFYACSATKEGVSEADGAGVVAVIVEFPHFIIRSFVFVDLTFPEDFKIGLLFDDFFPLLVPFSEFTGRASIT